MNVRTVITNSLRRWWFPVSITGILTACWVLSFLDRFQALNGLCMVLWILSMIYLLSALIYQLALRRWLGAVISFLFLGAYLAVFFVVILANILRENFDGDHWADNLSIPKNIPLEYPVMLDMGDNRPDSIAGQLYTGPAFRLYQSFQPGLYQYDIWYGKIPAGTVYLRAYEVTREYRLSKDRLKESSSISIENTSDSIRRFSTNHIFTIYEGDWGKPYAARFEAWFIPKDGGEERKLLSRTYVIEGWQR